MRMRRRNSYQSYARDSKKKSRETRGKLKQREIESNKSKTRRSRLKQSRKKRRD